jgi:hypothetical protein
LDEQPLAEYRIAFEAREGYLYASVTGANTVETIRRYSADVRAACVRSSRTRALVVVNLSGPGLGMLDVYKAVAESSDATVGMDLRAAYVDLNPEHGAENMHLAESVAATRGIPVRTFRDIAAAEAWLLATGD